MDANNINKNLPNPNSPESDSGDARSRQLDNDFADLTDALLTGRQVKSSDELRDLTALARQLQTLMSDIEPPSASFRGQLARRLDIEWRQVRHGSRFRWLPTSSRVQIRQYVALAAALVLIVVVAILGSKFVPTVGTATGNITGNMLLAAGLFVIGLIGVGLWRRK